METRVAPVGMQARAERALSTLRERFVEQYGAVVFDVAVARHANGVTLDGRVLLPSQRAAAVEVTEAAVRESDPTATVENRIEALVERESHEGWFAPRRAPAAIRAMPGGELATELDRGDPPARRLASLSEPESWLVELSDGTLGWADPDDLEPVASDQSPRSVAEWRNDWRGDWRDPPDDAWRTAVQPWLGAPYRWGGSTRRGVDCSGFVQRVVRVAGGLGLPKHSADQVRRGTRIHVRDLAPGDLVYLNHLERKIRHIGVVVEADPTRVAHASLESGVVIEPLTDLLERYRLLAAVRLVPGEPVA